MPLSAVSPPESSQDPEEKCCRPFNANPFTQQTGVFYSKNQQRLQSTGSGIKTYPERVRKPAGIYFKIKY